MKKALITAIGIISLMTVSCNKEYKCNCTYTEGTETYTIGNVKARNQKKADELCQVNGTLVQVCTAKED